MLRKLLVVWAVAAIVVVVGADAALAKAVKSQVAVTPSGTAKVMLNFSEEESIVIANVNCSNLEPETTYLVEVLDGAGAVMGSESFTTKADKSNSDNPNKNKPKPDKPKKHGKMKGHVNLHIPWVSPDPLIPLLPPDLTTWSVRVTAQIPVVPTP